MGAGRPTAVARFPSLNPDRSRLGPWRLVGPADPRTPRVRTPTIG